METLEKSANASGVGSTAYDFLFLAMTYARLGQLATAQEFYAKGINSWNNRPSTFSPFYDQEVQALCAEAEAVLGKQKKK